MAKEMRQAEHEHDQEALLKLEPTADLQEVGPCRIKISIQVGADKIRTLVDRRFEKLNASVAIPGFRRGHAPRTLLERRFGKEMLEELKADLVDKAFKEVAEEKHLEPIADPNVLDAEKLEVRSDAPFAYAVEIEVMPTVELRDYTGLKVKKPVIPLEEKEIDEAIEELRDRHAEWEPVQEAARQGDQVVSDLELWAGGETVSSQENTPLILDEGIRIHGTPLEGFYKVLVDRKAGEEGEYAITLPEGFSDPALAGKEIRVRVKLKGVKRKKLPELDAEFFKIFDADDLRELREEAAKRLKRAKEREARVRMVGDLMEQIQQANDFAIPESLIERSSQERLSMAAYNLLQQGAPPEEIRAFIEARRDQADEGARRRLKEHLILDQIAKKEKIFVTEEEVEQHVARMASEMGRAADELTAELEETGMLAGLRRRLRTDKVLDFLLSKAQVE